MRCMGHLVVGLVVLAAAPQNVVAKPDLLTAGDIERADVDTIPGIAGGQRIRVTVRPAGAEQSERYTGTLERIDSGTFLLEREDHEEPTAIATSSVLKWEVRQARSRGRGALRGLAWGAAVGSAIGLLAGSMSDSDMNSEDCTWFCWETSRGEDMMYGAFAVGIIGGALGAALGVARPGERWVEARPMVGIAPRSDGGTSLVVRASIGSLARFR